MVYRHDAATVLVVCWGCGSEGAPHETACIHYAVSAATRQMVTLGEPHDQDYARAMNVDPQNGLDAEDRASLDEALCLSEADIAAGRLVDASDVLEELRSR